MAGHCIVYSAYCITIYGSIISVSWFCDHRDSISLSIGGRFGHGHWLCWMSTGTKNGLMWTHTHTHWLRNPICQAISKALLAVALLRGRNIWVKIAILSNSRREAGCLRAAQHAIFGAQHFHRRRFFCCAPIFRQPFFFLKHLSFNSPWAIFF